MGTPEKRALIGDNEPTPKKLKLVTDYVCKALECIVFRLVEHNSSMTQLVPDFPPDYAHQTFGEDEEIKGYTGLQIDVYLSAATAQAWVDIKWAHKKYICDDVQAKLMEAFASDGLFDKERFEAHLTAAPPSYMSLGGETKHTHCMKDGSEVVIQLFKLSSAHPDIQALHKRFAPLLLFFIDGVGEIESDDPRWDFLVAFRKVGDKTHVVGVGTIYNYFHFPEGTRPRLAQVFVLPPYQGQGLGSAFVETAYKIAKERDSPDLTVEDPSPELQTLRQKCELKTLMACPWFCEHAEHVVDQALSSSSTGNGAVQNGASKEDCLPLNKEILDRIRQEEKIHAAEAEQVWEAYLWQHPKLQSGKGRRLVEQSLRRRLHAAHFSSMEQNAAGKALRDYSADGFAFEMVKAQKQTDLGSVPQEDSAGNTANVGKRSVAQVTPEEIANTLQHLLEEREQELDRVTGKCRS